MTSYSANRDQEPTAWPSTGGGDDGPQANLLQPSDALGRYVVLYRLGTGGMGVVYAAYDPKLDRKVALKLLRRISPDPAKRERAEERLLDEARSMARLNHPNVITVHDIAVVDGRVFVAMEYVDGGTLSTSLARGAMQWRDVVDIMLRAGRGLAAAHDAGIVHRDFKPDNVMLAKDGRVLVMDFGLARALDPDVGSRASSSRYGSEDARGSRSSAVQLHTGRETPQRRSNLVGTPAYMAPEQHGAREVDGRTDQFAFCVTLYEALFGQRPFRGDTAEEIAEKVEMGRPLEPPAQSRVPNWVKAVFVRGLSVDPAMRYPSMHALLDDLGADPARRRKRLAIGGGAVVLVGLAAFAVYSLQERRQSICEGGEERLAGVWDDDRKVQIERAFLASDKPYAAATWRAVETALEGYANNWVEMHRDACEATRLRGEQSGELLDLRMNCLGRRARELQALGDLFVDADADVVESGVAASGQLVPLAVCADAQLLRTPVPPPENPQRRRQIDDVRDELAKAKAHEDGGRYLSGLSIARVALEQARRTEHEPLIAEALFRLGRIQLVTGDPKAAEETLREAVHVAAVGHHDEVAARAWIGLAATVGHGRVQLDRAEEVLGAAEAAVERAGGSPDLRASLETARGATMLHRRDLDGSQKAFEAALAYHKEAYGEIHPDIAKGLNNLAVVHGEKGDLAQSRRYLEDALAIQERQVGPDHPAVATFLLNLGAIAMHQGEIEYSRAQLERSVAIFTKSSSDHPDLGRALGNLANVRQLIGDIVGAERDFRRAVELQTRGAGDHPDVARIQTALGALLVQDGRVDEGMKELELAHALLLRTLGDEHPEVGVTLSQIGVAQLERGDRQEAVLTFEAGMKLLGEHQPMNTGLSEVKFAYARAVEPDDAKRAVELAREARAEAAKLPPSEHTRRHIAAIETFLARHR